MKLHLTPLYFVTLFAFLFGVSTSNAHAQNNHHNIDPQTGRVSNFNTTYRFTGSYVYDYDLKTYSNVTSVNSIIGIQIDETGTGRFIIKIIDKNIFEIEDCVKEDDRYSFTLVNRNGYKIRAFLITKNNKVFSFWLNRSEDNTALVLYNR